MQDKVFWLKIIIRILRKLFNLPEPPVETETDTVANLKAQAVSILALSKPKMGSAEFQLLMLLIQLLREWLLAKEQTAAPEMAKSITHWLPSDADIAERFAVMKALVEIIPDEEQPQSQTQTDTV
ncbi:MAG: hypothetical protein M0R34_00405 [Candidatus Marinimicrobia bacterium]|nr:hypothetical protein [Candidatus Neomarinimicrobiota bacterium]